MAAHRQIGKENYLCYENIVVNAARTNQCEYIAIRESSNENP